MTLQEACDQIGIECREVPADGKFHPVPVIGKPATNNSGRIKLFADNAGGFLQNHVTGEKLLFWFDDTPAKLTTEEKERRAARLEEVEKQLAADREKCRIESKRDIDRATPAPPDHPYLVSKGVKACGIQWQESGNKLLLTVEDMKGTLHGWQSIGPDGEKRFKPNTVKAGNFHRIPGKGKIIICEGFATGTSIHEATGACVLIAFDAGNLLAVSRAAREKWQDRQIIIAADNDAWFKEKNEAGEVIAYHETPCFINGRERVNIGVVSATAAAQEIGAALAIPSFTDTATKPTDFNDLHQFEGLERVRQIIETAAPPAAETAEPANTPEPPKENPVQPKFESQENQPEETEKEMLARLAKLSPLAYDRAREVAADALGVRAATLDKEVAALRKNEKGGNDIFDEVEPWPEPIDPGALLHDVEKTVRRFIACNHEVSQAAALWIALTWFIDVVQVAPLAIITAPEKRCGKSQLLNLMAKMSFRAIPASGISPAALFRAIELWSPTLFLDESDAFLKENEELRGLLNSGHTRDTAFTIRVVGDSHTVTRFKTWGAKALAGIGHVADTLLDRAIILELRRKLSHEEVDRIRHAKPELFEDLKAKLARFADDYRDKVRHARPPLPESLNDRAQDNWDPLLSIAMVAGGNWLQIGTAAALKISGSEEITQTTGTELLSNIKEIFEEKQIDRITTAELIKALCADEEWNWATYNRGLPIKPRQLANRLKAYDIHSKSIRFISDVAKGYGREQFTEAFNRYTLSLSILSVTELQTNKEAALQVFKSVTQKLQADSSGYKLQDSADCYQCDEEIQALLPLDI